MTTAADQLIALLRQERDSARALHELMARERAALTGRDADLIVAISREKLQLGGELQRHMAARNRWLQQLGLAPGAAGVQSLVAAGPTDSPLAAEWRALTRAVEALQQLNDVNGGIVALNRNHVRQALGLLIGQQELAGAYDREGNRATRASRSLARA